MTRFRRHRATPILSVILASSSLWFFGCDGPRRSTAPQAGTPVSTNAKASSDEDARPSSHRIANTADPQEATDSDSPSIPREQRVHHLARVGDNIFRVGSRNGRNIIWMQAGNGDITIGRGVSEPVDLVATKLGDGEVAIAVGRGGKGILFDGTHSTRFQAPLIADDTVGAIALWVRRGKLKLFVAGNTRAMYRRGVDYRGWSTEHYRQPQQSARGIYVLIPDDSIAQPGSPFGGYVLTADGALQNWKNGGFWDATPVGGPTKGWTDSWYDAATDTMWVTSTAGLGFFRLGASPTTDFMPVAAGSWKTVFGATIDGKPFVIVANDEETRFFDGAQLRLLDSKGADDGLVYAERGFVYLVKDGIQRAIRLPKP